MNGKDKCKILKQIRQEIADANDIPYITENCEYQGDCKGTCPKCEADLRYLEAQLDKRRKKGLSIMVAGMSLLTSVSMAGCQKVEPITPDDNGKGDIEQLEGEEAPPDEIELAGDVLAEDA